MQLVLEQAKMSPKDLDAVVLVGGSTLMPQVRQMMKSVMGREPYTGLTAIDRDQVRGLYGAADAGLGSAIVSLSLQLSAAVDVAFLGTVASHRTEDLARSEAPLEAPVLEVLVDPHPQ